MSTMGRARDPSDSDLQELPNDDLFRLWKVPLSAVGKSDPGNNWDSVGYDENIWELSRNN